MKEKIFILIIVIGCLMLTGCQDNRNQEEIDRIGNLINGT